MRLEDILKHSNLCSLISITYNMKTQQQLINNIIGQLNGIQRMIDEDKDCFDVIIQMKAAKSAFSKLLSRYLEENFMKCAKNCKKQETEEMMKKLMLELSKQ